MSAVLEGVAAPNQARLRTSWKIDFPVLTYQGIIEFSDSIKDRNPLHRNDDAALSAGFNSIIAPGVMIMGFVSAAIAGEIPGVQVRRLDIEFKKPLYPSASPSVECTILKEKKICAVVRVCVKNLTEIIAEGECLLVLPRP